MDLGSVLPPKIPPMEGMDKTSGLLMTMGEFYGFKATSRELEKPEDDDYFTHQRIVRQYMVYNDHLLVIHDAGTGKTRTTLGFLHEIVNGPLRGIYKNVIIATPSELLHKNWENNPEIEMFSDKLNIKYTTHGLLSRLNPDEYPGTFFVIDEAHVATGDTLDISFDRQSSKLRNIEESRDKDAVYMGIWNILHNSPLHKVLLLTATPMQNSVEDFYSLVNLILPVDEQITSYDSPPTEEEMLTLLAGRVSYVRSAEEGVDISYGLSKNMNRSLSISRLLSGVGKINLGYLFNVVLGKKYYIPGVYSFPTKHVMIELINTNRELEAYVIIDLDSRSIVMKDVGEDDNNFVIQISSDDDNGRLYTVTFDRISLPSGTPVEEIDFVFSIPTTANSQVIAGPAQKVDIVETILSSSQTLYFASRVDEIRNKPLEEKGLSIANNQLIIIDDPVSGFTPEHLYHVSNLFGTIVSILLLTLSPEARTGNIKAPWIEFIGDEVVETGKNILFSEYVESSVGGIRKIGDTLNKIGYTEFSYNSSYENITKYGKAPRYIVNPSPREIDLFNSPDNWDGSYIQVSLYSSQGAKGVSYKDIRHIHLLPHWSPAENTQALYRGIRAKSHDVLKSRLPENETLEVRVYKHVSTPMPSLVTENNQWLLSGVTVNNVRYFGEDADQDIYIPPEFPDTLDRVIRYENTLNDYSRVIAKELSATSTSTDYFTDFQFTINGFGMQFVPNPSEHPETEITGKSLRLPPRPEYANEINVTFYSPMAYKLIIASRKDKEIASMRLIYKQAAMDCDLNRRRNILSSKMDNTEWCDYQACSYECLPSSRGLEIVIDSIDPNTGNDVRWDRPWAPITTVRDTTGDVYPPLSGTLKNQLLEFTIELINRSSQGYVSIYSLLLAVREKFGTRVSERNYLSFLSRVIFSEPTSDKIRDRFNNRCVLKTQGIMVYLCPLYDSERKIYVNKEGTGASRYVHGSIKRVFSNQGSWEDLTGRPPSYIALKREYELFMEKATPGREIEECFSLARRFEEFVRVIEGAFITTLENDGRGNVIYDRFSKYFMETTLDKIDKQLDREGNYVTPAISPWKYSNKQNVRVYFHLLYHMHPNFSKVKKPLSENSPIKIMIDVDKDLGFIGTTDIEQRILYAIAEESDKRRLFGLTDLSRDKTKNGIIGILDDKKFIDPAGKLKLEYFKIFDPSVTKESPKHPQGKVCTSYSDSELRKFGELFGVDTVNSKLENCRILYNAFKDQMLVS